MFSTMSWEDLVANDTIAMAIMETIYAYAEKLGLHVILTGKVQGAYPTYTLRCKESAGVWMQVDGCICDGDIGGFSPLYSHCDSQLKNIKKRLDDTVAEINYNTSVQARKLGEILDKAEEIFS